jgi:hypothetical protein
MDGRSMLEIRNLRVAFGDEFRKTQREVLRGLEMTLGRGEIVQCFLAIVQPEVHNGLRRGRHWHRRSSLSWPCLGLTLRNDGRPRKIHSNARDGNRHQNKQAGVPNRNPVIFHKRLLVQSAIVSRDNRGSGFVAVVPRPDNEALLFAGATARSGWGLMSGRGDCVRLNADGNQAPPFGGTRRTRRGPSSGAPRPHRALSNADRCRRGTLVYVGM